MSTRRYPGTIEALGMYGIDVRRIGRRIVSMGLVAMLLLSISASADWRVYDDDVDNKLASQNRIGQGDFENAPKEGTQQGRFKDPPRKFTAKEQDEVSSVDMGEQARCPEPKQPEIPEFPKITDMVRRLLPPAPDKGKGNAGKQWTLCKEIVETEKARFKYGLMMSELAEQRYARLQAIQTQRARIDGEHVGELQSNTNKMLALLALIQIDQQQQKAYDDAYAARIAYLKSSQERLGQDAANGNPSAGRRLAGNAAALIVMELAFDSDLVKAKRR